MSNLDLLKRGFRAALMGSVAGVLAVTAAPIMAQAQTADDDEEKSIVVTGSRIARSDFTSDSPLTVVTGEQIRDSGLANLGEALKQQLGVGSGGFSQTSVLNGGGATSIDLRNFGAERVLVLINGKRIASFADSLANEAGDLSFIPIAMVERVEILRDGASATYGQDAITGVVNVILKDDFEGLNISALQGISSRGDAEITNLSAVVGGNFERGNAVLGVEYRFADNVRQRERDWATPAISFLDGSGFNIGSFFSPGGVFFGTGGAVVCADWAGPPGVVAPPGSTVPGLPIGGGTGTVDLYGIYGWCPSFNNAFAYSVGRVYENYSYDLQQDLLTQQNVLATAAYVTYDITDWLEAYVEAQYSQRESTRYLDGNPGGTGTPNIPNGWIIPTTNPYNFTGQSGSFYIRPTTTIGTRDEFVNARQSRAVVGLRGSDLIDMFDWELAYVWTQVNVDLLSKGEWNLRRANVISDPALCASDPLCVRALSQAGKLPGDALNAFLPGTWAPSEIAYLRIDATALSEFETTSIFGLMQGELFDLPAGALGIALGFEYREEIGFNKPDSFTEAGENVANQTFTTQGEFDVTELSAEVDIPILKDFILAQELKVNLQGRWFEYSNFGSDEVWKVGVNWAPTQDIRLRFNQGTSFRAPTITDLFGGGTVSFVSVVDPCNGTGGGAIPPADPTVLANCTGATPYGGVTYPYVQISTQRPTLAGSNANLSPETADTMTLGVVVTPRWVPNFQATFDYWQIELEDTITTSTAQSIMTACYEDSDAAACARITRAANGQTAIIIAALENQGSVRTDGYDMAASFFFDDPLFGTGTTVTLDAEATYLTENSFNPGAGNIDSEGSSSALPRWVGQASVNLDWDNYGVTWRTRYIADMDDTFVPQPNFFGYTGPEYQIEHDLRATYEWNNVSFLAGVNNVFDEEPPYVFESGNNTAFFLYNVVGRYFFGRVTVDF